MGGDMFRIVASTSGSGDGRGRPNRLVWSLSALVLLALVAAAVATFAPWRGAAEASVTGASMSISISGQTGKVSVVEFQTFTVTVHATAIPEDGYVGAAAWVDFGDTGLIP